MSNCESEKKIAKTIKCKNATRHECVPRALSLSLTSKHTRFPTYTAHTADFLILRRGCLQNRSEFAHNMLLSHSLSLPFWSLCSSFLLSLHVFVSLELFVVHSFHCSSFAFNIYFVAFNLYDYVITYNNLPACVVLLLRLLALASRGMGVKERKKIDEERKNDEEVK